MTQAQKKRHASEVEAKDRRIAELEAANRGLRKFTNCGGAPTGKTCCIDGHAIYGPFWSSASGEDICEFHGFRELIEQYKAANARLREALTEAAHDCDLHRRGYPHQTEIQRLDAWLSLCGDSPAQPQPPREKS